VRFGDASCAKLCVVWFMAPGYPALLNVKAKPSARSGLSSL
jgi:hypothetical protein